MSASRRAAVVALALLALPAAAQVPDLAAQGALPIDLDAASSEFDRRNNRLVFRQMHITQGPLSIRADVAEATRLDFENSRWIFRGNVKIDNQGASVASDEAELVFLGHELRTAALTGTPVRFEQLRPGGKRTEGRAGTMDYDVVAGRVSLSRNAWLSDGANEVSGERLTYDLRREVVTADSGSGGPVRMKINPPPRGEMPAGGRP